jgi:aminoglycoside phosphotransferase (APT) family kinase protein
VNNEVWMTPELVVRVSCRPEQRLRREAQLSHALPPEVGYPPIVGYGAEMGSEWLVLERLPGLPLSRCWPALSREERRAAIRDLAVRLRAIHSTPTPPLAPLRQLPQPIDPAPSGTMAVARVVDSLERAGRLDFVDRKIMRALIDTVHDLAASLDTFSGRTLIHGDLSFENVLWSSQEKRVIAILDFEWARGAPPDLDLDVLLRFCAFPDLHVPTSYASATRAEDYAEVPTWMAEDYAELFSSPHQLDRCRLFAIAWDVEELLTFPPLVASSRLDLRHPYRRLQSMLVGDSHLDRMNHLTGITGAVA